jgi:Trypsin-like peptidase domain
MNSTHVNRHQGVDQSMSLSPTPTSIPPVLGLRIADQETARVVAVYGASDNLVGAGCLISNSHIFTCRHLIGRGRTKNAKLDMNVRVRLIGVPGQPDVQARVAQCGQAGKTATDLALLAIEPELQLAIPPVEFASPLRHRGKTFSALGFPRGRTEGRNARGFLHAVNADGLVQMDGGGSLDVRGGFSGAPVWSAELGAFVGLIVSERFEEKVSWCIPSRVLCDFYNELPVRFRVPPSDRPQIHDYEDDDPNVQLYGTTSDNGHRRLTAR